jgi:hypothetical protein
MRPDLAYHQHTPALQSIQVFFGDPDLDSDSQSIGTAAAAIADPRLSAGERRAVRNVVDAVEAIHTRFGYAGFDDAEGSVALVLRYHKGPESSYDYKLRLPTDNPFAAVPGASARRGVLLPRSAAYHELVHMLQTQVTGHESGRSGEERGAGADVVTPAQAKGVREGLADAFTALERQSWRSGAAYLTQDGGDLEVVRDFAQPASSHALMQVDDRYVHAAFADPARDPHATGGLVVVTARELQQRIGWSATQDVLWRVLHDPAFGRSDQAWDDLADAFGRVADTSDPATSAAIRAALHTTALDTAG